MDILIAILITSLIWFIILLRCNKKTINGTLNVVVDDDSLLYSMTLFEDPEEIQYKKRLVLKIEK